MKVKEILPIKEQLESNVKTLEKLEKLFINNVTLDEEIAEKAVCNKPLYQLFAEIKLQMQRDLLGINEKINNAEIV